MSSPADPVADRQRAVCVYCASGPTHPELLDLATRVGAAIADRGWTLVSGGGNVSAMGAVADGARSRGGRTIGVIPKALVHRELADVEADEEAREQIAFRATEWAHRNQGEYLTGYLEATGQGESGDDGVPRLGPVARTLLDAYQADKAVYETVYEARNRPGWLGIPLGAIARITESDTGTGKEEDA